MKVKENRKFVRLRMHHLLKYKIIKQPEEERAISFIRDISAGGALFHTQEYIPLESIVILEIVFPAEAETVVVHARVVRVKFLQKVGIFAIGVEFIDMNQNTREFINKKVLMIYKHEKEREVKTMRLLSSIFLFLGLVGAVLGFLMRFTTINIPVAPMSWVNLVNMILLFSIALSLLAIARK